MDTLFQSQKWHLRQERELSYCRASDSHRDVNGSLIQVTSTSFSSEPGGSVFEDSNQGKSKEGRGKERNNCHRRVPLCCHLCLHLLRSASVAAAVRTRFGNEAFECSHRFSMWTMSFSSGSSNVRLGPRPSAASIRSTCWYDMLAPNQERIATSV